MPQNSSAMYYLLVNIIKYPSKPGTWLETEDVKMCKNTSLQYLFCSLCFINFQGHITSSMYVSVSNICWLDSASSVHTSVVSTCLVPAPWGYAWYLISAVLYYTYPSNLLITNPKENTWSHKLDSLSFFFSYVIYDSSDTDCTMAHLRIWGPGTMGLAQGMEHFEHVDFYK